MHGALLQSSRPINISASLGFLIAWGGDIIAIMITINWVYVKASYLKRQLSKPKHRKKKKIFIYRIKNIRLRERRAPVGRLATKPVIKEGFETLAAHHRHVASSYAPLRLMSLLPVRCKVETCCPPRKTSCAVFLFFFQWENAARCWYNDSFSQLLRSGLGAWSHHFSLSVPSISFMYRKLIGSRIHGKLRPTESAVNNGNMLIISNYKVYCIGNL